MVTLNSTVGIEALLFGKPVITLADACYNIDGLVRNASNSEQLNNLIVDKGWLPNERLRLQFLGYVWNEYLLHGYFDNLPSDILLKIENIIKIER